MMKVITLTAAAAMTFAVIIAPQPAAADNGRITAGVIGGLAVGAVVGSQMNRNDNGYRHSYSNRRHRAYRRECRIERRDWEDRYGRLHIRRVKVCD